MFSFMGGGGVSLKTDGSCGSKDSCHSDSPSRGGVSLNTDGNWGSKSSCHLCSASRVGVGSL